MRGPSRFNTLFVSLALLSLTLVVWWVLFLVNESNRFQEAADLLRQDLVNEAITALGGGDLDTLEDAFQRRRTMFISEGSVFAILILAALSVFLLGVLRERRMRIEYERFLSGATHALKTPLATLRLGLQSLAAGTMPESKKQTYLEDLCAEVDRLERGVGNILSSAASQGGFSLQFRKGDLNQDVQDIAQGMQARFERAGIELEVQPGESCSVSRDPSAMQVVLQNLLENSLKYCRSGQRVSVKTEREQDSAILSVTDNGAGIDAEDLPHVFDRFFRGSRRLEVGGSGLGLHLSKQLVEAQGGSVLAISEGADKGTRIEVRIPLLEKAS